MLLQYKNQDTKSPEYKLIRFISSDDVDVFNKFVNWVIGEFDLYLKNESKKLKVYFPNGWFSIGSFINDKQQVLIEIKIKGKSKVACDILMVRLICILNQVIDIQLNNES